MKLKEYLSKEKGRASALAKAINTDSSTLSFWANGQRPVPIVRCVAIERETLGQVTRKDLRTDWKLIWPELN